MRNIHLLYFSPALSTQRMGRLLALEFGGKLHEHNITTQNLDPLALDASDLLVAAMPVYAGRVPELATQRMKALSGNNTPAVALCVYGNRHYDDAVLELTELLSSAGFVVMGAGAFVAKHSIFNKVATQRPTQEDIGQLQDFAHQCQAKLSTTQYEAKGYTLAIPGNKPYKPYNKPVWVPETNSTCSHCGTCATHCPVQAIDHTNPTQTDPALCISCAGCIAVCPQQARAFTHQSYTQRETLFVQANAAPRANEMWV